MNQLTTKILYVVGLNHGSGVGSTALTYCTMHAGTPFDSLYPPRIHRDQFIYELCANTCRLGDSITGGIPLNYRIHRG